MIQQLRYPALGMFWCVGDIREGRWISPDCTWSHSVERERLMQNIRVVLRVDICLCRKQMRPEVQQKSCMRTKLTRTQ